MTFWGAGPKYTLFSTAYCSLTIALSIWFDPFFQIPSVPCGILTTAGILLILPGVPFYIISLVTVKQAYNAGRLVTRGPFGMCRHPVYSAWIIFFVPGIMLLINTWIGLSAPPVMYLLVMVLVKDEETYLKDVFGKEYEAYKKRTPLVVPVGWFTSIQDTDRQRQSPAPNNTSSMKSR